MRKRRCVAETVRPSMDPSTWSEVWHIVPARAHLADDWCPIACSENEGITMPGPVQTREPTCPDCRGETPSDRL